MCMYFLVKISLCSLGAAPFPTELEPYSGLGAFVWRHCSLWLLTQWEPGADLGKESRSHGDWASTGHSVGHRMWPSCDKLSLKNTPRKVNGYQLLYVLKSHGSQKLCMLFSCLWLSLLCNNKTIKSTCCLGLVHLAWWLMALGLWCFVHS